MTFNLEKTFGWTLLSIGIVVIIWTLYSSYNIFTNKTSLPEFFKIEKKEVTFPIPEKKVPANLEEFQEQLNQMIVEQLKEILPVDFLPKIINLVVWSIFATIFIFGGSQIASLGIKLLKK